MLLCFFQTQSAVVTSARSKLNSTLCNPTAAGSMKASDTIDQQASQSHGSSCISSSISSISSSRVIVVGLEAASSSSWQKAIHRTAEAAANVMASAAASVFHCQLLERVCTAASQTGSTLAGQNWGSSAVGDSGQEQGWVRSTSGIEKAVAELQAGTQHQEGSDPPASRRLAETTGHLQKASGDVEEVPGQVTAAGADRNVGKRDQAAVNKNDLHKGLQLYAEVRIPLSKSCMDSILPWQHHAIASAILGAANGVPFCSDYMTAYSCCPHQHPLCTKSILTVSSDALACQHGDCMLPSTAKYHY